MIFVYCVCKVRYSCELIHIDLAKLSSLCAGQLQHLIALLGEKNMGAFGHGLADHVFPRLVLHGFAVFCLFRFIS